MAAGRDRAAAALSAILDDDHGIVAAGLASARRGGRALPCRRERSGRIPTAAGFIAALAAACGEALDENWPAQPVRLLFSAHGLPLKIVRAGDPYPQRSRSDGGGGGAGAGASRASIGGSAIRAGSDRWPGSGPRSKRNCTGPAATGWRWSSRRSRLCPSIRRRWSNSISIIAGSPRAAACRHIAGCRRSAPIRGSSPRWPIWCAVRPQAVPAEQPGACRARHERPCCGRLSLAEGAAHHRGDRLDGGSALFAAALSSTTPGCRRIRTGRRCCKSWSGGCCTGSCCRRRS